MIKTYIKLALVTSAFAHIILLSHLTSLTAIQQKLYHYLGNFITALLTAVLASICTVLELYEKNSYNAIACFGLAVLWSYNAFTAFGSLKNYYYSKNGNKKNHKDKESL